MLPDLTSTLMGSPKPYGDVLPSSVEMDTLQMDTLPMHLKIKYIKYKYNFCPEESKG